MKLKYRYNWKLESWELLSSSKDVFLYSEQEKDKIMRALEIYPKRNDK